MFRRRCRELGRNTTLFSVYTCNWFDPETQVNKFRALSVNCDCDLLSLKVEEDLKPGAQLSDIDKHAVVDISMFPEKTILHIRIGVWNFPS